MSFNIRFPSRAGAGDIEDINTENNIILIGANGSGKTRLGIWIEEQIQNEYTVHRLSAQKALNIPEYAQIKNLEQAEKELLLGRSDQHASIRRKMNDRWGNEPAIHLLDDYSKLLSLLFAKSRERDKEHTIETRISGQYIPVPDAPIDTIMNVWSDIMPHREISFSDGKVMVNKVDEPEYHGREMSDGERIALYFLGQCLCTPEESVIIIDEPEMHLHKSLVDKLWNKIEELSDTKLFIYITHDLDFASSRADAKKLWIKNYNGENSWEWDEVEDNEYLPESLILEILGNRKNVIFCEGEKGSLDTTIYQLVYPTHHLIPRGSSQKVIESTRAFRGIDQLHHLNTYGLIDSDYRDEGEKDALRDHEIYTISVAEIENLFCIEPILRITSEYLTLDPDEKVEEVIDFLIEALEEEFENQVSSKAERIIQYKLCSFTKNDSNVQGLEDGLNDIMNSIQVQNFYEEAETLYRNAIDNRDLEKLLLIYNRKSILKRISSIFGLAYGEYENLFVRLLKSSRRDQIVTVLNAYLPELE